jgi:hypothetical protein
MRRRLGRQDALRAPAEQPCRSPSRPLKLSASIGDAGHALVVLILRPGVAGVAKSLTLWSVLSVDHLLPYARMSAARMGYAPSREDRPRSRQPSS